MPKMKERMHQKNTETSKLRDTEFKAREMAREVLATLKSEIKKVELEETTKELSTDIGAEPQKQAEASSVKQTVMDRKRGLFRYRR